MTDVLKNLENKLTEYLEDLIFLKYEIEKISVTECKIFKEQGICDIYIYFNIEDVDLFKMSIKYKSGTYYIVDGNNNNGIELELNKNNFYYQLCIFYTDFIKVNIMREKGIE